jgi:hypothetical protein
LFKNGYDSTHHSSTFLFPPRYLRLEKLKTGSETRNWGRSRLSTERVWGMIVRKCNDVADTAGKANFARTRPTSVKLFDEEGYRVLEEIEISYEKFGMEGKSKVFVMKREVGGV